MLSALLCSSYSLMAAVPFPGMLWLHREEIGGALVLNSLGEPKKDPVANVTHPWSVGRSMRKTGVRGCLHRALELGYSS